MYDGHDHMICISFALVQPVYPPDLGSECDIIITTNSRIHIHASSGPKISFQIKSPPHQNIGYNLR